MDDEAHDVEERVLTHDLSKITSDLPLYILRSLALIRGLDEVYTESIDKFDDESRGLCKRGLDDKTITRRRGAMSKLLNSALRCRHETLNEADRLYELIDINFNKLSADINKLEDQIRKSGQIDLTEGETNQLVAAAEAALQKRSEYVRKKAVLEEDATELPSVEEMTPSRTRRSNDKSKSSSSRKRKRETSYDDPGNPFEPTYCICERVSFGEMIACDNDRCTREWFHLECVGLNVAPTGKWFCKECTEALGINTAPKRRRR